MERADGIQATIESGRFGKANRWRVGGTMVSAKNYSIVWVRATPLRMMQIKMRAESFAEVSSLEIEKMALSMFPPQYDPAKPRAWGMLVSDSEADGCLRIVCSRSASNSNVSQGLRHDCSSHLPHNCLINKDGLIQTGVENNHAQVIPVKEFLKLRAHFPYCDASTSEESKNLLDHLKTKYPGRHICFSKGSF